MYGQYAEIWYRVTFYYMDNAAIFVTLGQGVKCLYSFLEGNRHFLQACLPCPWSHFLPYIAYIV